MGGEGGGDANLIGESPPFETGDIGDVVCVVGETKKVGDNRGDLDGNLEIDVSTDGSLGAELAELLDGVLTLGTVGSGWRTGRTGVGTCSRDNRGGEEEAGGDRGGGGGVCTALNLVMLADFVSGTAFSRESTQRTMNASAR